MDCKNNEICERCKEKNTIIEDYENGIIVCNNCGKVYEERIISNENEKRTFEGEDGDNQIQRVGPPTKPQYGNEFGTTLVIRDHGKTKIIKSYSKYSKIQRAFGKIQSLLSSKYVQQKFIEETKSLYETFSKNKNMQRRNLKEIILAIYYYVCRKAQIAKTFKQISLMFSVEERRIKKAFNSIKLDIVSPPENGEELNEIEKNLIRTYLGDSKDIYVLKMLSFKIVDNINEGELLEGKSPRTVAGISLFLSYKLLSDNFNDKEEFYNMFSNKTTLMKAFNEIKAFLQDIIPNEYTDKLDILSVIS